MPLHLQSLTNDYQDHDLLTSLLMLATENPDGFLVTEDKYLLSRYALSDEPSGMPFGSLVITMKVCDEENVIRILDLDITLENESRTVLHFLEMRDGSSDSNEYYEAETEKDGSHLELETVCRHAIRDSLSDSVRDVSISAFPFQLSVFEDIEAFNQWAGFDKEINVKGMDFYVHGFSEHFIMPGSAQRMMKEDDEIFSFLLGKVDSWKEIRWKIGDRELEFVIIRLDTALGTIPVAAGREVFDLSGLAKGAIIAMSADIKADLSRPGDFVVSQSTQ